MGSDWLERISPCLRPALPGERQRTHTSHGRTGPNWIEPLRVIYDHELVLFSEGRYKVEIDGREYDCPAGTFIIIPPGRLQTSWESAGKPGHRHWAHFDWTRRGPYHDTPIMTFHPARPLTHRFRPAPGFVPKGVFHGEIPFPRRAYDISERLSALQEHGDARDRLVSRALLLELLLGILAPREGEPARPDKEAELAHRVRELLAHAVDNRPDLPSVQDLLEELGYSYAHLCRVFRAKYGIAPLKYIHALRVGRAKLLLRDTDLTVSQIAYRLGADDPLYFSQLFRKMTGLSPSRFRQTP